MPERCKSMLDLKPSSEPTFYFSAGMLLQALADGRYPGHLEAAAQLNPGCDIGHHSPVR
jgi:hypothetical protein